MSFQWSDEVNEQAKDEQMKSVVLELQQLQNLASQRLQ